jgi:UDP-GlcNAc:undecaprenyl-phosphate GlcNAc-1-phosphate transferase
VAVLCQTSFIVKNLSDLFAVIVYKLPIVFIITIIYFSAMSWSDFLILFLISGFFAGLMIPILCRFCFRAGFLDLPGEHKRHKFPTPNLGGIAIFLAFWITVIFAYNHYQPLHHELFPVFFYIFAGGVLVFLTGLIDDLSGLSALFKLTAQVVVGLILYQGGLRISILYIPLHGPVGLDMLSLPVTLLWLVGLINSINLIDGLDGLAAGVSAIAALALLFVGISYNLVTVMVFSVVVIGATLVFLFFNNYPARIFMGDSGSLFLGYIFAVISILFPIKSYTTAAIFIPLLALGVPVIETVASFWRRVITGQRFYKADNRHLFHFIETLGFSKAKVVWAFYFLSAVFAVSSGAMIIFDRRLVFTILVVFMVVIFGILIRFTLANSRKNGMGKAL